jgi:hypothetical protein
MTNKTFNVAGITVHDGNSKVRFTDDLSRRVKQFAKGGASRVDFVQLPSAMTKVEALKYMLTLPEFANAADQATISEALSDRENDLRKGEVRVKAVKQPKVAKSKPSLDSIKNRAKKADATVDTEQADTVA